ncbi:MAG: zinc-ribbon domain-containing protein [Ktedonobacterales bacterium]|nr:zinc-ribbon domain-containing protein [Ktedonobacterales bacterium]
MIVYGIRSRNKVLGQEAYQCSRCQQTAYHTGVRTTRWFTLFYIPVIAFSKKTTARCGACGFQQQIDNKDADRIFTQARVPAQHT